MRRRSGMFLAGGLSALLVLTACGGGGSSPGSGSGTAAAGGEITVATAGPMTGDNSVYGIQQLAGIQLSVDQLNAAGGIASGPLKGSKVKVVSFDDAADPNQGASIAQQICDDPKILAVFGHVNSSVTLAAEPIYERCGTPVFVSYSSNPKITAERHANLYRTLVDDAAMGAEMAGMAQNKLGFTKAGVLSSPDDYGNGLLEVFKTAAKQNGLTIADAIGTSPKQKDFTPQLTKLRNAGADGLVLLNTYTDAALQIKQAYDMGWKVPILVTASSNNPDLIKIAGKSAAEGVYVSAIFDPKSPDPAVVAFVNAFKAANKGEEPSEGSAVAYNTAPVLWDVLAQGASDRASVITNTEKIGSFTLPITAAFKFNQTHAPTIDPKKPSQVLLRVQGGTITTYKP